MTLKEKFIEQSIDIRYQVLEPEKFEKIADDYAIEFAEWYYIKCIMSNFDMHLSTKKSLEIFKKEKAL